MVQKRRPEIKQKKAGKKERSGSEERRQRSAPRLVAQSMPPAVRSVSATFPCLIVIVLATVVSFYPAIDNEFVHWDDYPNLVENVHIRELSGENLRWMMTSHLMGVWQPLTWFITAIEYQLFDGANTVSFSRGLHVANIVLHAVASVLCFFVIRRLLVIAIPERAERSPVGVNIGATFAALLFAIHPLRVEVVAWASGQPYILAVIWSLASVCCYLIAHQSGGRIWHLLAWACLACSLLCKALGVPLVAVLLVLDVYPLRRFGGQSGWHSRTVFRALLEKIPYAVLALAAVGLAVWSTAADKTYKPEPAVMTFMLSAFCMMFYVTVTFIPHGLAPYYMRPFRSEFSSSDPWFVLAVVAAVVVTVVFIVRRRRWPGLLTAWATYLVILLPVVGFVRHGGQLAADRYSYLSCIGWAVLVGAGIVAIWSANTGWWLKPATRVTCLVIGLGIVVGLGWMTSNYCRVWHDSISLWSAMVERNPKFHMGYYNLAKAYKRTGDRASAEASYRKAIELNPKYPEANVDLGNMLRADGDLDGAMTLYETALEGHSGFHMAHLNIAYILMTRNRNQEALKHLELAEADAIKAKEYKRLPSIRRNLERLRAKTSR